MQIVYVLDKISDSISFLFKLSRSHADPSDGVNAWYRRQRVIAAAAMTK